jgi:hypothetical protein
LAQPRGPHPSPGIEKVSKSERDLSAVRTIVLAFGEIGVKGAPSRFWLAICAARLFEKVHGVLTSTVGASIPNQWAAPATLGSFADRREEVKGKSATVKPTITPARTTLHFLPSPRSHLSLISLIVEMSQVEAQIWPECSYWREWAQQRQYVDSALSELGARYNPASWSRKNFTLGPYGDQDSVNGL